MDTYNFSNKCKFNNDIDFNTQTITNMNATSGSISGCNLTVGSGKTLDLTNGTLVTTNGLENLTSTNITQLQNLGSSTISTDQWTYLSNFNQSLSTTDNVVYNSVKVNDSNYIKLGTDDDLQLYHNGTNSYITNATGDLVLKLADASGTYELSIIDSGSVEIANVDSDGNSYFAGNMSIGTTNSYGKMTIFTGTSGYTHDIANQLSGSITFSNGDSSTAIPMLVSKSSNSVGLTFISATADNNSYADMSFNLRETDNTDFSTLTGGGFSLTRYGTYLMRILRNGNMSLGDFTPTEKFEVDGNIKIADSKYIKIGTGDDLQIYHDGTDSYISNATGDITIKLSDNAGSNSFNITDSDDSDVFVVDSDGSFATNVGTIGNVKISTNTIEPDTGETYIDIGSTSESAGGFRVYNVKASTTAPLVWFGASGSVIGGSGVMFGQGSSPTSYNNGYSLYVENSVTAPVFNIAYKSDASTINSVFRINNNVLYPGGGNETGGIGNSSYRFLNGYFTNISATSIYGNIYSSDSEKIYLGTGNDLQLYHNGTTSYITNATGDLVVKLADDVGTNKLSILDSASQEQMYIGSTGILNLITGGYYSINGTSVLNATTLGSGVTGSSLTSVGTLTGLGIIGDQSITGNLNITSGSQIITSGELHLNPKNSDGALNVYDPASVYNLFLYGNGGNSSIQGKALISFHPFQKSTVDDNTDFATGQFGLVEHVLTGYHSDFVFLTRDGTQPRDTLTEKVRIKYNGYVGIGNTDPSYQLDITGNINFTGSIYQNGSLFAGSSQWTSSSSNIYYTTGYVGIGNTDPSYQLDITGNINFTGSIYQNGSSVLNATTLGSGVTTSSLTSVGTLTGLTIGGNLIVNGNITTSADQNAVSYFYFDNDNMGSSFDAGVEARFGDSSSSVYTYIRNSGDGTGHHTHIGHKKVFATDKFYLETETDLITKLGDNAGTYKFIVYDSDDAEVAYIDSDGRGILSVIQSGISTTALVSGTYNVLTNYTAYSINDNRNGPVSGFTSNANVGSSNGAFANLTYAVQGGCPYGASAGNNNIYWMSKTPTGGGTWTRIPSGGTISATLSHNFPSSTITQSSALLDKVGYVCEVTGTVSTPHDINEVKPYIQYCSTDQSSKVIGVLSTHEGDLIFEAEYDYNLTYMATNNYIRVNAIGEGLIRVSNINGNITAGDLLCGSIIEGYARKSDDDLIRSSTVGKAIEDCNFDDDQTYDIDETTKGRLIGCIYMCG
jgi:hypothetical protein